MAAAAKKKLAMKKAITPFIPSDIMANIFKRLPARSLTRLQSVNKEWENLIKNLIKTPSFVQDHLHYSGHRNPSLVLQQHEEEFRSTRLTEQYRKKFYLTVLDRDMRACEVQNLPSRFKLEVVSSCNGLVCVKMVDKGVYPHPVLIWNPVTREVRKVPPRTIIIDSDDELCDHLGFGYSPLDNDYKIVRIIVRHPYNIEAVEVYSLNSGTWNEVDFGDNLNSISISGPNSITLNGVMFFDACWDDDGDKVLSFDLSTKVCTIMPMPFLFSFSPRCLIEYENKLGLVAYIAEKIGSSSIHLWVMNEDTNPSEDWERGEWTKIYTSSPYPYRRLYPLTTTWRNEIVLLPSDETENNDGGTTFLYLLNPKTNVLRRLAVGCDPHNYGQTRNGRHVNYSKRVIAIDIFNYVESYVSVNGHEY